MNLKNLPKELRKYPTDIAKSSSRLIIIVGLLVKVLKM